MVIKCSRGNIALWLGPSMLSNMKTREDGLSELITFNKKNCVHGLQLNVPELIFDG